MSEPLFCLLSYCAELENKSNDLDSIVYLVFDHICNLADTYPSKIEYREELEILMYRILIRPLMVIDSEESKGKFQNKDQSRTSINSKGSAKETEVFCESNISKLFYVLIFSLGNLRDFITMNAKFVTKMFMLYDCQPYSENMAKKCHKLLLQIAKTQFTSDSDSDNVIVGQDSLKSQLSYLNSALCFLRSIEAKDVFSKYGKGSDTYQQNTDLIKTLLANKQAIGNLENILKTEGGRKAIKKGAKELLDSELQTESMVADRISEILLYSRNISVEAILEQIGDKRETETLNKFLQRFEPLIFNKNLEKSIRELFTSFRLAGVESAVVERVLEHFGHFYYDLSQKFTVDDGIIKFVNKAETYEFVYLLIMLHT